MPNPVPTGTVTILDGGNAIAVANLDSNGNYSVANTQLSTLSVGSHNLTASYSGDGNYLPSVSPVVVEVVTAVEQSSTITLSASPNPVQQGQQVTCSGTVS
jgi:large repetitive protein